jgi:peptidoglycan/LPS O-acetylase OafA/YrhL
MDATPSSHSRIKRLDGLRACAIMAVFLSHAFRIRMLWIGVDLFFVLSGFLITGILLDLKHKDIKGYFAHFYERRARRILPPYVILMVVVSLIFGLKWVHHWYMYLGLMNYVELLQHAKFAPTHHLWSLGVEEQFYLVWPFAVYFLKDKKLPYLLGGLIILAPILRLLAIPYDRTHELVYMGTPFRMDCLAMGSLLTFVWRAKGDAIRKYGYLGLIPVVMTPVVMIPLSKLGGFSTVDGTWKSNLFTYEIALCAATGAFLWAVGGRYTGILETRVFQFLGRISYTFYLIHESALEYFERYTKSHGTIAGLALVATIGYAAVSWYWIEKPILAGGSRKAAALELAAASGNQTGALSRDSVRSISKYRGSSLRSE